MRGNSSLALTKDIQLSSKRNMKWTESFRYQWVGALLWAQPNESDVFGTFEIQPGWTTRAVADGFGMKRRRIEGPILRMVGTYEVGRTETDWSNQVTVLDILQKHFEKKVKIQLGHPEKQHRKQEVIMAQ
jgi:hypothetical protein